MYNTVRSSRLYEQIVEQITRLIMDGTLVAGDQLPPERELAAQFGVSRTAVREAVKALHQRGLIDIQPGRGTFINDMATSATGVVRESLSLVLNSTTGSGLRDLIQVRAMLEPAIAALAAEHAEKGDRQAMSEIVDRMDHLLDDMDGFIAADQEFHFLLAQSTQNSLIPILLQPIVELLQKQRRRIFLIRNGAARGQKHHKQILKAILDKNPAAAHEAMRAHIEQVTNDSLAAGHPVDGDGSPTA